MQEADKRNALEIEGLTKRFGGLVAVSRFSLRVGRGELIGLIGPNGAGKTTVFNLLSGVNRPNAGSVRFYGEDITARPPHVVSSKGLIRTFQQVRLMSGMTVAANLRPAFHDRIDYSLLSAVFRTGAYLAQEREMDGRIESILRTLDILELKDAVVDDLPYGLQRRVGIARALCREPKMLLLDEPTAGLNPRETDQIVAVIRRMWEELGMAIVIVEHNMRVVMNISQRIVVMNKGEVLAEGTPGEIQGNEDVARIYLGEKRY